MVMPHHWCPLAHERNSIYTYIQIQPMIPENQTNKTTKWCNTGRHFTAASRTLKTSCRPSFSKRQGVSSSWTPFNTIVMLHVFAFFVPAIFHYISYLVAFNTCIHCRHSERIINHPLAWLMCSATPSNWMIRPMRSFVIREAHFFPLISVEHLHTWW